MIKKGKTLDIKAKPKEWDSTFQLMSWWKKDKISQAKVLVVGAGALGNEVLKNLTLLNVGHILIVDFDRIEYSNLSRSVLFREEDSNNKSFKGVVAASRIKEINPNIKVQTITGDVTTDVGLGVFRRMDVIIGCLDNRLARLFLNRMCFRVQKTWIDGAIENLGGQAFVYKSGVSCYECSLTQKDWNNIKFRLGCPDIARRNLSQGRIPTTPISSSIIGAVQTQEALKVIHGNDEQSMAGNYLYYEGMNNLMLHFQSPRLKENCISHFVYDPIVTSPLSSNSSVEVALAWLGEYFRDESATIMLDHELALKVTTKITEKTFPVVIPISRLTEEEGRKFRQLPDEDLVITESTHSIGPDFERKNITLNAIGIPSLHIIRVFAAGEEHFVELTGDESFLNFK